MDLVKPLNFIIIPCWIISSLVVGILIQIIDPIENLPRTLLISLIGGTLAYALAIWLGKVNLNQYTISNFLSATSGSLFCLLLQRVVFIFIESKDK
ncbi:MAG: hypothetical protein M1514_00775 [Patescibacteria group bacterium]|nr:hypothetical protein [Patescibacteria group bacterium]